MSFIDELYEHYKSLLGRAPLNINDCEEGVRDAKNGIDHKEWMGPDYTACYNKTKIGGTET